MSVDVSRQSNKIKGYTITNKFSGQVAENVVYCKID